jgi:hypothetical protein
MRSPLWFVVAGLIAIAGSSRPDFISGRAWAQSMPA